MGGSDASQPPPAGLIPGSVGFQISSMLITVLATSKT